MPCQGPINNNLTWKWIIIRYNEYFENIYYYVLQVLIVLFEDRKNSYFCSIKSLIENENSFYWKQIISTAFSECY